MQINAKARLLAAPIKVPGIRPGYFNAQTVERKSFSFTDDGDSYSGAAYLGKVGKTDKYAIAFVSNDFGFEPKLSSFPDEAKARKAFAKFKDGASFDVLCKVFSD